MGLNRSLFTIQSHKISKGWVFYETLKIGTSSKTNNGEGGQNGEVVMVSIDLKEIFLMDYFILDHYGF